jgi:hypothetical protein
MPRSHGPVSPKPDTCTWPDRPKNPQTLALRTQPEVLALWGVGVTGRCAANRPRAKSDTGVRSRRGRLTWRVGHLGSLHHGGHRFLVWARLPAAQERGTKPWLAVRFDASTFGIIEAFPDDEARRTHLAGTVWPGAQRESELFPSPPTIANLDVLAEKL